MSPIIDALTAQVTRAEGIEESAVITINGIAQRIADAVAAALANGATAEQLQPVADLGTALDSESTVLADAIAANQPPPGP
jgi:hypothetical protein